MSFPAERPRRLRRTPRLRALVREHRLAPEQLIYPLFVAPGVGVRK
ncbi:MAG TPA: porphobilinogen synthase, partial [Candidatus Polarisedimenticolia bacterium]|nr:porphobilinogen synthase [Candidatus Polarisedimenticolia bacterium]